MWNDRLDDSQAGIKIAGRNINNLRYADDTTLMAESNSESESHSAVSDSELYSPWNSPGQNTGVGSRSLLQENVPPRDRTQVSHIASRFFTSWTTKEAQDKKQWGTKQPLDEGERGESKGWLKTQHSEN